MFEQKFDEQQKYVKASYHFLKSIYSHSRGCRTRLPSMVLVDDAPEPVRFNFFDFLFDEEGSVDSDLSLRPLFGFSSFDLLDPRRPLGVEGIGGSAGVSSASLSESSSDAESTDRFL